MAALIWNASFAVIRAAIRRICPGLGVSCGHPRAGGHTMTEWLSKEDKKQLVVQAMERWNAGFVGGPTNDVLKAKMELEAIEAATRAANASERNAKYMLWATVFAAISAVASFLAVIVPLLSKH